MPKGDKIMKRSYFKTKRKTGLKRSGFKKKPKKTARGKKMALKREIIKQYDLPNLECKRWGIKKGATRTDILRGMLWNVFSRFIRHRDAGKCITCLKPKTYEELQAGHYAPVGGTSVRLWFDEINVNGECEYCNAFDAFHLIPMRRNLIEKYGVRQIVNIEYIKAQTMTVKWDEAEYIQRIKVYLEKLQQYENN